MATLNLSLFPNSHQSKHSLTQHSTPTASPLTLSTPWNSTPFSWTRPHSISTPSPIRAVDGDYSAKRSSSNESRETILLPGCDFNHWLIVMEFPKDPAPTREQMIDTYLKTLATVLGRFFIFLFSSFSLYFLVILCLLIIIPFHTLEIGVNFCL